MGTTGKNLMLDEVDWHLRKRREDMARLLKKVTQGGADGEAVAEGV
ncbi:MAG: hypothetical protein OER77_05415 [Myxococcales bacterium]|nr:hypothetical protein [Myxococcales bacterium]